jgi:hypothetical protein
VSGRPNVFVVGDAKCGTTSLYQMLADAPGVAVSAERKELHWFSRPDLVARLAGPGDERLRGTFVDDEAEYLSHFAHATAATPVVVDVSPSYLRSPGAAARIAAFDPQARIVVVVRDPVDKVVSQYRHLVAEGREASQLATALEASEERRAAGWSDLFDYVGGGAYAEVVGRYLTTFGADRVRVEVFEELYGDDPAARDALATWLGTAFRVAPPHRNRSGTPDTRSPLSRLAANRGLRGALGRFLPRSARRRVGRIADRAVRLRQAPVTAEDRAWLRQRYAEDTATLERLLGRDLPWSTSTSTSTRTGDDGPRDPA